MRHMSYAPFLAAAFILWPVMGALGGQGYSPLLVLAALPALFVARPGYKPALYLLVLMAFLVWAIASEYWSPASRGIVSGSLLSGDFAVRSAGLRMALTLMFGTILIAGALKIQQGGAQMSARIMLGAFAVQGLMIAVCAVYAGFLLRLVYGDDPGEIGKGVQNINRNANAFALVLPVLVAYLGARPGSIWKAVALGIIAISMICFLQVDTSSALIGAGLMLVAFALVRLLPRHGLRWLFSAAAAYIAAAPFLMSALINGLDKAGINLPASFYSRVRAWDVVIGKIQQAPFIGHGIEASETWRETYADHPAWLAQLPDFWAQYPVIPGHPHNMALQIWGETGAIGAGLAALGVVLIGWRLPSADTLRPDIRYAIAGMLAVAFSLFSFSYSMWNEAFWSSIAMAGGGLVLLSRRERGSLA